MKLTTIYYALLCIIALSSCGGETSTSITLIPIRSGDDFGYADWEGKIVINPQFSAAGLFKNGIALVRTSGDKPLYGYIDESGKYLINPSFKEATEFEAGIAMVVAEDQAPKAINEKGEELFTLPKAEMVTGFKEGMAGIAVEDEKGRRCGFINTKGEIVIPPQFNQLGFFREGKCVVRNEAGKYGYIDKTGKFIINPQFDLAEPFEDGTAIVYSNAKGGVIDEKGTYLFNPQFDHLKKDGDTYIIESGGKTGWADSKAKIFINPQFDMAMPFNSNALAPVKSGGSWGYIDKEGKFKINPQFNFAYPFVGNKALVAGNNNQIGVIDSEGKFTVNPQFDNISMELSSYLGGIKKIQSINTDFFDIAAIVNRVKRDITPETVSGFTFSTSLGTMMNKYPQSNISYYGNDSYLFRDEKINKYATLTLYVSGTIFISSGWSYKANPDATVEGFTYNINLSGKALQKEEEILKAFGESGFNGYKSFPSGEGVYGFSSNHQTITIGRSGYGIHINIQKGSVAIAGDADSIAAANSSNKY